MRSIGWSGRRRRNEPARPITSNPGGADQAASAREGAPAGEAQAAADTQAEAGARPHVSAAPDLIEPVLGFRAWMVAAGGELRPMGMRSGAWTPGVVTAVCAEGRPHAAPDTDCSCGLYAYT